MLPHVRLNAPTKGIEEEDIECVEELAGWSL
jgi:hypothetical protein